MTSVKKRRNSRNTTRRKVRTRKKTNSNALFLSIFSAVIAIALLIILTSSNTSNNDNFADSDSHGEEKNTRQEIADEKQQPKVPTETPEDIFWDKWRKVHQDKDIDGLIALAQWCEKNDLSDKVNDLYREVLLLEPDHVVIRNKMGYVKTNNGWLLREHVIKKNYILYKDVWYTSFELQQKGLMLHQGKWLSADEMRQQGYVLQDGNWVNKHVAMAKKQKVEKEPVVEEPIAKDPAEEEPIAEEEPEIEQPVANKKIRKDIEQQPQKTPQSLSVIYNLVKINTPKGLWSQSEEHILQREDRRRSTGTISLHNEENAMHITVDSMAFGRRLFHNIGGVRTTGDNIETIMRGYTTILQQNGYSEVKFTTKGRRVSSRFGAMTQFYGKASLEKTTLAMVFSFFKHRENTYCVMISVPKNNYNTSKRDIQLLLRNIQEQ